MGADMLIACFTVQLDTKPDFEKGHALIKELAKGWEMKGLPSYFDHMEDAAELEAYIYKCLEDVKIAYKGKDRDTTSLQFSGTEIILTGGLSYGDSPSNLYNSINDLYEIEGVFEACGLNSNIDYKKILDKILKQKVILPTLMSLDPDLDKMIAVSLNAKEKPCKKKKK